MEDKGRIQVFSRRFLAIFDFLYWSGSRRPHEKEIM